MMARHFVQSKYRAAFAALIVLLLAPVWVSAQPVPGKDDRLVATMVCEFLQEGHVTRPMIGDEISKRLFRRFLKDLDPGKVYFLKSDIDEFKKHETELDDMLLKGDISFAYKVYDRFLERIGQRLKLIDELADTKFDFTVKEYLDTDTAKMEYAANDTGAGRALAQAHQVRSAARTLWARSRCPRPRPERRCATATTVSPAA